MQMSRWCEFIWPTRAVDKNGKTPAAGAAGAYPPRYGA
jgi:hypothetical protein